MKRILMINQGRSQIAEEIRKSGKSFVKNGNTYYVRDTFFVKFIKSCDVNQELIDWADIIYSRNYSCPLLSRSGKVTEFSPNLLIKGSLYGQQKVFVVLSSTFTNEVKVTEMLLSKDDAEVQLNKENCFRTKKEAEEHAKQKLQSMIQQYEKALVTMKKQLKKFEKE